MNSQATNLQNRLALALSVCSEGLKPYNPPTDLTVSEWADEFRKLSSEASSEPGQWRTSRAPYQKGILDAISDPSVHTVVVMSSAQVGKTEFILNVGYADVTDIPQELLEVAYTIIKSMYFEKESNKSVLDSLDSLSMMTLNQYKRFII